MKIIAAIIMVPMLSGCGFSMFVPPKENSIIEDQVGEKLYRTVSTTSERRLIIINDSADPDYRGLYCAEPSPDSADNLVSSITAYLKAKQNSGPSEIGAEAGFDKMLATTVQQLGTRSQGLQFFRDGTYALCQAYMNNTVSEEEYVQKLDKILNISRELIEIELRYKDSFIPATPIQEKTPNELITEQQESKLKALQAKTAQQEEDDKLENAKLTAELNRQKETNQTRLETIKLENELLEERKRHELAILENELAMLTKKAEIKKKEAELSEEANN